MKFCYISSFVVVCVGMTNSKVHAFSVASVFSNTLNRNHLVHSKKDSIIHRGSHDMQLLASTSDEVEERRRDIQARLAEEGERLRRLQMEAEQIKKSPSVQVMDLSTSSSTSGKSSDLPKPQMRNRPMTSIEKKRLEALMAKEKKVEAEVEQPIVVQSTANSVQEPSPVPAGVSSSASVNQSSDDFTRPMTTVERKRMEAKKLKEKMMGGAQSSDIENKTFKTPEEAYAEAYKKAYEDAYKKSVEDLEAKMRAEEMKKMENLKKSEEDARKAEAERLRKSIYEARMPPKPVFQTSYPRPAPRSPANLNPLGNSDLKVEVKNNSGSVAQQVKFPLDLVTALAIPSTVAGAIYLRSSLENRPQVKKEKEMERASEQIQSSVSKIESAATKIEKSVDKIEEVEKRWGSSSSYLDSLKN